MPAPCGRGVDRAAGGLWDSLLFAPAIRDIFALSSFIWMSAVFIFGASAFAFAFFSLASSDITPRFGSGLADVAGEGRAAIVVFGVLVLGVAAPVAVDGEFVGKGEPVFL